MYNSNAPTDPPDPKFRFLQIFLDFLSEVGAGWGESNQEVVSFRSVRAFVRAVWLPNEIWTQISGLTFSLSPFGAPNFSFPLVYEFYGEYKVYKVLLPPATQTCPTSVGSFGGIFAIVLLVLQKTIIGNWTSEHEKSVIPRSCTPRCGLM